MKTILYSLFFLTIINFSAQAQSKFDAVKYKKSLMMPHLKNQQNSHADFRIKVNPYWDEVEAPHSYNGYASSYIPQIKITSFGNVWGKITFDTMYNDSKMFLHTTNNGKTWMYDSISSPAGYAIGSISAPNNNTCYAAMYDGNDYKGGAVYKTTDGGYNWKKLSISNTFADTGFIDFVYFFNTDNGIVVADNDGTNTSYLSIYTTHDAGKTWQRIPVKNMQPTKGSAFSSSFDVYATLGNTIWFKAYDDLGNNYILRSDDLGKHWQTSLFNITGKTFHGFAFADKQNGLMVGYEWSGTSDTYVAATHDGGKTWNEINDYKGQPMGLFVTVLPGTHTYISTTPAYVPVWGSSYSKDGGKTWNIIDSGYGTEHSAIDFLNPFYGWTGRAEVWDGGLTGGAFKWKLKFSLDDNIVADNKTANLSASKININTTLKLFPNPSSDKVVIQGLSTSNENKLSLYNVSGSLLQQVVSGNSSYQFNIQKLPTGNYYIKVESGSTITTLKFVKE